VVGVRERDHKLAGALHDARERDAGRDDAGGADDVGLVAQELPAHGGLVREETGAEALEALCVVRVGAVPHLLGAPVQEVDGVEVHVLNVPRERRAPHAEVEVGAVHAGEDTLGLEALPEQVVELRDVPRAGAVLHQRRRVVVCAVHCRAPSGKGLPVPPVQLPPLCVVFLLRARGRQIFGF